MHYALADAHLAQALRELVQVVLAVEPTEACAVDQPATAIEKQEVTAP